MDSYSHLRSISSQYMNQMRPERRIDSLTVLSNSYMPTNTYNRNPSPAQPQHSPGPTHLTRREFDFSGLITMQEPLNVAHQRPGTSFTNCDWSADPAFWPVYSQRDQWLSHGELSPSSSTSASPSPSASPSLCPPNLYPGYSGPAPAKTPKTCAHCGVTSTPLWRREPGTGQSLCNACGLYLLQRGKSRPRALIEADMDTPSVDAHIPDSEYSGTMCANCRTRATSVWRKNVGGQVVCNACGVYERLKGRTRPIQLRRDKVKPRTRHVRRTFILK